VATQTEVDAACEAIAARGERPTVERVRVELGGGSPNALTPLVRAWKEARQQPRAEPQQIGTSADPMPLPIDGLAPVIGSAVARAAKVEGEVPSGSMMRRPATRPDTRTPARTPPGMARQ
jgi:Plasmid replication region DNA-binding N-term